MTTWRTRASLIMISLISTGLIVGCDTAAALAPSHLVKNGPSRSFMEHNYTYQGEVSGAIETLAGVHAAVAFTVGHRAFIAIDQKPQTELGTRGRVTAPQAGSNSLGPIIRQQNEPTAGPDSSLGQTAGIGISLHSPLVQNFIVRSQNNPAATFVRARHIVGSQPVSPELYEAIGTAVRSRVPLIDDVYVASDPTAVLHFSLQRNYTQARHPVHQDSFDDLVRRTWHAPLTNHTAP